jgi:translation initiation factor 4G
MEVSEYFKQNRDYKVKNSNLNKVRTSEVMSDNNGNTTNINRKMPTNNSNRRDKTIVDTTKKLNANPGTIGMYKNVRTDNKKHDRYEEKSRKRMSYNTKMYNPDKLIANKYNPGEVGTSDNPPSDNPPSDNPPSDNPPSDNPPSDNPPSDNPPSDNPPSDNPPSDNPSSKWRPRRIDTSTPDGKIQENVRTAQGYLNKMTQTTFENLSSKFVEIAVMEHGNPPLPGQLKLLIDRIFEQALLQPTFCPMYSSLCEKIHKEMKIFRRVLLNKCQEEFEIVSVVTNDSMSESEKDYAKFKAKKRMLGNIKFIAELFKSGIIVEPVMYECFNHLLKDQDPDSPDEEQIEGLCKLMLNIGKILDANKNNKRFDNYIEQLKKIQNGKLSTRIKFLIDDVIDVRQNNWSPLK